MATKTLEFLISLNNINIKRLVYFFDKKNRPTKAERLVY